MYAHRGNALAEILITHKRAERRQRVRADAGAPQRDPARASAAATVRVTARDSRSRTEHR